jgi:hypothetical protein
MDFGNNFRYSEMYIFVVFQLAFGLDVTTENFRMFCDKILFQLTIMG